MLMTLSATTGDGDARDLGYLLHKHPDRVQSFSLSFGQVHVFYPEATATRCTAALLLDMDPVALSRRRGQAHATHALEPYVNDRPYAASSHMSTAISKVLGTALSGQCKNRPELVDQPMQLSIHLPVLPCRGGGQWLNELFEPLGYTVESERLPLDPNFEQWGMSRYWNVRLHTTARVTDVLSHLYVLIPVLDDDKHYYISRDEVDKLLRHGQGWLAEHPAHESITRRYLDRRGHLVRQAMAQLQDSDSPEAQEDQTEAALEKPLSLHQVRLQFVTQTLEALGARRVLDLGCGEGKLIKHLLQSRQFDHILGVDVVHQALKVAARRLKLDKMPPAKQARITLKQGSLVYRDDDLRGYDAAAIVEVIEHMEEDRLDAMEDVVFAHASPTHVIITTPNVEYNAKFEGMAPGSMRHKDHRFEWDRATFETWAKGIAERHQYTVRFEPIGPVDETLGAPSQAAIFSKLNQTR